MTEGAAIINYCTILRNTLTVDNQILYQGAPETDFETFSKALYKTIGLKYPKFYKMDNLSKLGFLAAEALVQQVPEFENYDKQKTGIFVSNAYSCLDTDERYYATVKDKDSFFPSPGLFVYTLPNILIGEICIRHKITGEHAFFLSEQFDTDFTCLYVNDLFASGLIESALTGWTEFYQDECRAVLMWLTKEGSDNPEKAFTPKNVSKVWQSFNH